MRFGIIGLGRMGAALARNALDHGHDVIAWNRSQEKVEAFVKDGGKGAASVEELIGKLPAPRVVWVMLPAGDASFAVIGELMHGLEEGDVIINGANEHFENSKALAEHAESHGIKVLDAGVSGGISGARHGACAMVGGDPDAYALVEPLFKDVCVTNGYGRVGPAGAGHYVKMVHNAVEYGMMESIGEGFDILHASEYEIDDAQIARVWAHGSVVRGWLMDLLQDALETKGLDAFPAEIGQSGEGLWSVHEALERKIAVPAIQAAVNRRFMTKQDHTTSARVIQALRAGFGGHDAKDRV